MYIHVCTYTHTVYIKRTQNPDHHDYLFSHLADVGPDWSSTLANIATGVAKAIQVSKARLCPAPAPAVVPNTLVQLVGYYEYVTVIAPGCCVMDARALLGGGSHCG